MNGTTHLRLTRSNRFAALSRRASQTVAAIAALICLPAIVLVFLISRTTGPDLFDLVPKAASSDGYALLAWYDLERGRHALHEGGFSTGTQLRALGYLMEGDQPVRDGQVVRHFVLLPDKGNAVHPAHRFGDQMIDVQLLPGHGARFSRGSLIWVWGTIRALPGDTGSPIPLYRLEDARIESANEDEIPMYFR